MRLVNQTYNQPAEAFSAVPAQRPVSMSAFGQQVYHDLGDDPTGEADVLDRLNSNMKRLSDLSGRMSFMMNELGSVLKVK